MSGRDRRFTPGDVPMRVCSQTKFATRFHTFLQKHEESCDHVTDVLNNEKPSTITSVPLTKADSYLATDF